MSDKANNAVLVVGGGIAGIKTSLDLAEAGRKVYVIDASPVLGGFLPLLDRQFPTNDCQICYLSPELAKSGHELDIELLPLTRLGELTGSAGDFTATLDTSPRYIDTAKCTACGACLEAAPEGAVRYTPGLDQTSPTCMRYPQTVPEAFSIDIEKVGQDASWTEVCEPGAIDLDQKPSQRRVRVGAVVVATGAELFDPTPLQDVWGYGKYPDVVTSLEFERILAAGGPTGGVLARPSDGKRPQRIGWIQCVGSRTTREPGKPYCSSVCCMFAMKEAVWALEHFNQELDATIFFMDMRPMGKDYEQYYQRVKNELGVNFLRCRPHSATLDEETGELVLEYLGEDGQLAEARLDMLVLATGLCAPADAVQQAEILGVELDPHAFVDSGDFAPAATSRPGVYACGMASGPKDIPDSLMQASAAAMQASLCLDPPRVPAAEKSLPPERDVSAEEPKVGVFLADFGGNAKKVVDFPALLEYLGGRPDVLHAEELSGQAEALDHMVRVIQDKGLNRVVVAGSSPRGQRLTFEETIRRAGLNRGYLEMANILEQDAWVTPEPAAATGKAKDLLRMAIGGAKRSHPVYVHHEPINHDALVVGGGVAGLSAALALADAGLGRVTLVERGRRLGGLALRLERSLDGGPVRPRVEELVRRVSEHPAVTVITDALVVDHDGQMGAFATGVQSGPGMYYQTIEHGVTVLATGAKEYRPAEYLYGDDPKVMTQLQLERLLAQGQGADQELDTVVMIQCVGSRNETNPSCGRICCRSAVKNALWIKELKPEARVFVLYRDMRMPYTAEDSYRKAREEGVLFVRYRPEDPPRVHHDEDGLAVTFHDLVLDRHLTVNPSAVVLSTPQVAPDEETEELAELFRLQRTGTGYLMEEHIKLKPVDSQVPGVFLAGSVLAPKSLAEAQIQGLAAAGRALTLLARESLAVPGAVARVRGELCAACLVCVRACPFQVPFINADGYSQIDPAKCQGCGVCAAECPAKAIQLAGCHDDQIMGRTDALLEGVL
jgi:heterodisulfide reductase subunit A